MYKIEYSKQFLRLSKKLPKNIIDIAKQKTMMLAKDPFHSALKTHKLHGKFRKYFSFSINYEYRIVFKFVDKKTLLFLKIGKHDMYE